MDSLFLGLDKFLNARGFFEFSKCNNGYTLREMFKFLENVNENGPLEGGKEDLMKSSLSLAHFLMGYTPTTYCTETLYEFTRLVPHPTVLMHVLAMALNPEEERSIHMILACCVLSKIETGDLNHTLSETWIEEYLNCYPMKEMVKLGKLPTTLSQLVKVGRVRARSVNQRTWGLAMNWRTRITEDGCYLLNKFPVLASISEWNRDKAGEETTEIILKYRGMVNHLKTWSGGLYPSDPILHEHDEESDTNLRTLNVEESIILWLFHYIAQKDLGMITSSNSFIEDGPLSMLMNALDCAKITNAFNVSMSSMSIAFVQLYSNPSQDWIGYLREHASSGQETGGGVEGEGEGEIDEEPQRILKSYDVRCMKDLHHHKAFEVFREGWYKAEAVLNELRDDDDMIISDEDALMLQQAAYDSMVEPCVVNSVPKPAKGNKNGRLLDRYKLETARGVHEKTVHYFSECEEALDDADDKVTGALVNPTAWQIVSVEWMMYMEEESRIGPNGGVLALSPGMGKTLICLLLIVATHGKDDKDAKTRFNSAMRNGATSIEGFSVNYRCPTKSLIQNGCSTSKAGKKGKKKNKNNKKKSKVAAEDTSVFAGFYGVSSSPVSPSQSQQDEMTQIQHYAPASPTPSPPDHPELFATPSLDPRYEKERIMRGRAFPVNTTLVIAGKAVANNWCKEMSTKFKNNMWSKFTTITMVTGTNTRYKAIDYTIRDELSRISMSVSDIQDRAVVVVTYSSLYEAYMRREARVEALIRADPDGLTDRSDAIRMDIENRCTWVGKDALRGSDLLYYVRWKRVICDEGHCMTGDRNKAWRYAVASLNVRNRWIVTGTPYKRAKSELKKMLEVIDPDKNGCIRVLTEVGPVYARNDALKKKKSMESQDRSVVTSIEMFKALATVYSKSTSYIDVLSSLLVFIIDKTRFCNVAESQIESSVTVSSSSYTSSSSSTSQSITPENDHLCNTASEANRFKFSPLNIYWVNMEKTRRYEKIEKHILKFCGRGGNNNNDDRPPSESSNKRKRGTGGTNNKEGASSYWLIRASMSNYIETYAILEGLSFGWQSKQLHDKALLDAFPKGSVSTGTRNEMLEAIEERNLAWTRSNRKKGAVGVDCATLSKRAIDLVQEEDEKVRSGRRVKEMRGMGRLYNSERAKSLLARAILNRGPGNYHPKVEGCVKLVEAILNEGKKMLVWQRTIIFCYFRSTAECIKEAMSTGEDCIENKFSCKVDCVMGETASYKENVVQTVSRFGIPLERGVGLPKHKMGTWWKYVGIEKKLDPLAEGMSDEDYVESMTPTMVLVCTGVLSEGLNLECANNVIFPDLPKSEISEEQSYDRCHRMTQRMPVNVFHLYNEGSMEEETLKSNRAHTERVKLESLGKVTVPEPQRVSMEEALDVISYGDYSMDKQTKEREEASNAELLRKAERRRNKRNRSETSNKGKEPMEDEARQGSVDATSTKRSTTEETETLYGVESLCSDYYRRDHEEDDTTEFANPQMVMNDLGEGNEEDAEMSLCGMFN